MSQGHQGKRDPGGLQGCGGHDWMVLHRVRLAAPRDGTGNPVPGPAGAEIWRCAPDLKIDADDRISACHDIWGGFALFADRARAEGLFADPGAALPFLADAVEAWHALAVPHLHRGSVRWRMALEHDSAVRVAPRDPGGPLVVLTSAGFEDPHLPAQQARIRRFSAGVRAVHDDLPGRAGLLRRAVFSSGSVDGREGCTMTLWRSDAEMVEAAYGPGVHREILAANRARAMMDRSAFTRGRIVASRGSWDGADPVAGLTRPGAAP